MKSHRPLVLCLTFTALFAASCNQQKTGYAELVPYLVEMDEYKTLDYDFADDYFHKNYDNWGGGGCSAISKVIDGHRLIGRNLDLNISYKNAYIVRTNASKYKTLGLAYTFRDISPDRDRFLQEGISDEFRKLLPFMCDDVLNEEGFHIEINMRHGEFWPNGDDKFGVEHTNESSDKRVYLFELPRYLAENCKTVEEAKEYVSTLDVYSKDKYWNYCFLVSDAYGGSSLLEFCADSVHWLDEKDIPSFSWLSKYEMSAIGQTNFYLNEGAWLFQDIKSGEGRFIALQEGIETVQNPLDMFNLMKKIQYSSYYLDYDECKDNHFDPRSECIGEISWAVYNVMMSPDFEDVARSYLNKINEPVRNMSRDQKQKLNKYWESSFTEVVDTHDKSIIVRFFENDSMVYRIDFHGTKTMTNF